MSIELPQGWIETSLGHLANYVNGKAFNKLHWKEHGLPIIRIQNLNNPKATFNYSDEVHEEKYKVQNGDLLIAWSASLGAYIWKGADAWLNQHIFRVEPYLDIVNTRYLYYAVTNSIEELYKKSHGMGMVHVTKGKFEGHEVWLPPLNEQIRIADKLDSVLAKVDAAQARLVKIPTLLKRFRQSVLAAATSGELTKEWRVSNDSEKWTAVSLLDVVESKLRNGYSPIGVGYETPVRNLTLSAVTKGYFVKDCFKYVDIDVPTESYLWVKKNDILIQRANSIEYVGISALYEGEDNQYIYPDLIMKCRANDKAHSKYIHYSLLSESVRKYFRENATGTSGNMPKINQAIVSTAPINLPPLEEQKEIVRRVESLFVLADTVEKQYLAAKKRTDRITQSLLAKAFRGELVPQDSIDEPAAELLKRIQAERQQQAIEKPKRKVGARSSQNAAIPKQTKTITMQLIDAPENYLLELLAQLGSETHAEVLWKKSELAIDDFYAKLKQEMQANGIVEDNNSPDPALRKLKVVNR